MLHIYPTCRADGALPLARTRRRNGTANERRVQRARLATSIALVEATNGEAVPAVPVEPDEPAARLIGRRGRRSPSVATVARTSKASPRRLAGA